MSYHIKLFEKQKKVMDNSRFLKKWLITVTMAICIVFMFRLRGRAQSLTSYYDRNPLYYLPIKNDILASSLFLSMMGGFNPYFYSLLTKSTDITSNLELYSSMRMIGGFDYFAPSLNSGLAIRSLHTSTLGNYPFMGITMDMINRFNSLLNSSLLNISTPATTSVPCQEITEEQCDSGLAVEDPMSNCVNLSSPDFEDLEIVFCTKKAEYSLLDACIPISVVISNTGLNDIHLSEGQAEKIANAYIGVYGKNTRFMKVYLDQTAGPAIQPGVFLKPGESATLSTMLDRDRVALYRAPPLSGGIVTRNMNFQGPWGTLGLGRLDISIDIDFGELPDSRVYDRGAVIDIRELPPDSDDIYFAAGNLIIRFEEDITLEEVEAFVDKYHCHIKDILELCSLNAVIGIPFELTTGEVIDAMLSDPDYSKFIEHIDRNYLVKINFLHLPDKGIWNSFQQF